MLLGAEIREFVFFSLGVYVIRIQSVGEKATKSSLKINILRSSFVLVNVKRRNSKKIRRLMIAYTRKFVFTHVAV